VEVARAVGELTHFDPEAGDAVVLWCAAIRHAILTGLLDVRIGLKHIPSERRDKWASWLEVAEKSQPLHFTNNGWVVEELQGAWSAIATTAVPQDNPASGAFRVDHLRLALDAAVRGGGDTDTVAAIAGGLVGGAYGASAVPADWRRVLHGWPGMRTRGLVDLASAIIRRGEPDGFDFSYRGYETGIVACHPYDDAVWLGGIGALRSLPEGVDAVVSLCRVGDADLPAKAEQIDVRLIDQPGANDNLGFVLLDTVRLVEQLRREGRTVLIHCVQAESRTPTVAALYCARRARHPRRRGIG
jgi:ADP-ribosyl-[dinitrogen reductase] hydrolase